MSPIDNALLVHATGQKLRLTRIKGVSTIQLMISVVLVLTAISTIAAFDFLKDNILTAAVAAGLLFFLLMIAALIRRYIVALAIKGDNLIITDLKQSNTVTSIRSLRTIHSYRLGPFCLTKIVYKLDGVQRKKFIFKRLARQEADPSAIIKSILRKNAKVSQLAS